MYQNRKDRSEKCIKTEKIVPKNVDKKTFPGYNNEERYVLIVDTPASERCYETEFISKIVGMEGRSVS